MVTDGVLVERLKSGWIGMVCGVAEEPRKLGPSLSVAVTVHVPEVAVMVTTPFAIEHDPLASIVNVPSPVEVAVGAYISLRVSLAGGVLVNVVVDCALLMVSLPLPLLARKLVPPE